MARSRGDSAAGDVGAEMVDGELALAADLAGGDVGLEVPLAQAVAGPHRELGHAVGRQAEHRRRLLGRDLLDLG